MVPNMPNLGTLPMQQVHTATGHVQPSEAWEHTQNVSFTLTLSSVLLKATLYPTCTAKGWVPFSAFYVIYLYLGIGTPLCKNVALWAVYAQKWSYDMQDLRWRAWDSTDTTCWSSSTGAFIRYLHRLQIFLHFPANGETFAGLPTHSHKPLVIKYIRFHFTCELVSERRWYMIQ